MLRPQGYYERLRCCNSQLMNLSPCVRLFALLKIINSQFDNVCEGGRALHRIAHVFDAAHANGDADFHHEAKTVRKVSALPAVHKESNRDRVGESFLQSRSSPAVLTHSC